MTHVLPRDTERDDHAEEHEDGLAYLRSEGCARTSWTRFASIWAALSSASSAECCSMRWPWCRWQHPSTVQGGSGRTSPTAASGAPSARYRYSPETGNNGPTRHSGSRSNIARSVAPVSASTKESVTARWIPSCGSGSRPAPSTPPWRPFPTARATR